MNKFFLMPTFFQNIRYLNTENIVRVPILPQLTLDGTSASTFLFNFYVISYWL